MSKGAAENAFSLVAKKMADNFSKHLEWYANGGTIEYEYGTIQVIYPYAMYDSCTHKFEGFSRFNKDICIPGPGDRWLYPKSATLPQIYEETGVTKKKWIKNNWCIIEEELTIQPNGVWGVNKSTIIQKGIAEEISSGDIRDPKDIYQPCNYLGEYN